MKNHLITCIALLSIIIFENISAGEKPRNYLCQPATTDHLSGILVPYASWHPFPIINERKQWENIPGDMRSSFIAEGEKYLEYKWPVVPASVTLDFKRNGNRSRYESISFGRRKALKALLFAELSENKGRFLDAIADGIWAICEETFWGSSAHLSVQSAGKDLPDVTEPIVELFSAETAALLSWAYYLLDKRLDDISPLLRPRIRYEIQRRVFAPYLSTDFGWMGFKRKPNNWNPWINSNVLLATLCIQDNETERVALVGRVLQTLDNFINQYPDDGGCDEGPSYWRVAGGRLFNCLEYLDGCTKGKINIYDKPLIKNIASYYYKMHISGNYFFNTGDGAAKLNPNPYLLYSIGKNVNDEKLIALAKYFYKVDRENDEDEYFEAPVNIILGRLFGELDIESNTAYEPLLRDFWLPESQYMGARSAENSSKGLFMAVQGGHNGESHNHNDVGNFVVFADGKPALIDIGVETYTAKTFSPQRYEIWTMQSAYHNLPTINGIMQKDGAQYKATDLNYESNDEFARLSMNIAKAYPEDAKVGTWIRTVCLNRNKNIELTEKFKLNEYKQAITLNFMTCLDPVIIDEGIIALKPNTKFQGAQLAIEYDKNMLSPAFEKIKIEDKKLKKVWGDSLTRIVFTCLKKNLDDTIKIIFKQ